MYIDNFKFLAQLGGELCEEQTQKTQKMRTTDQKTTFLGPMKRCNGVENLEASKSMSKLSNECTYKLSTS